MIRIGAIDHSPSLCCRLHWHCSRRPRSPKSAKYIFLAPLPSVLPHPLLFLSPFLSSGYPFPLLSLPPLLRLLSLPSAFGYPFPFFSSSHCSLLSGYLPLFPSAEYHSPSLPLPISFFRTLLPLLSGYTPSHSTPFRVPFLLLVPFRLCSPSSLPSAFGYSSPFLPFTDHHQPSPVVLLLLLRRCR